MIYYINEIRPYLFISAYNSLIEKYCEKFGLTHIIDATNSRKKDRVTGVKYLDIEVDDDATEDIKRFFEPTADFIKEARDGTGKVLVCCAAGISRSSTICIMYLVIHESLTLREAYFQVKQARKIIAPNLGFWHQMIDYEEEKTSGKSSVELIHGRIIVPDVYLEKNKNKNDVLMNKL